MQPLISSKTTSPWTEIFAPPDGAAALSTAEPAAAPSASTPAQADLPAEALFDCYNA